MTIHRQKKSCRLSAVSYRPEQKWALYLAESRKPRAESQQRGLSAVGYRQE